MEKKTKRWIVLLLFVFLLLVNYILISARDLSIALLTLVIFPFILIAIFDRQLPEKKRWMGSIVLFSYHILVIVLAYIYIHFEVRRIMELARQAGETIPPGQSFFSATAVFSDFILILLPLSLFWLFSMLVRYNMNDTYKEYTQKNLLIAFLVFIVITVLVFLLVLSKAMHIEKVYIWYGLVMAIFIEYFWILNHHHRQKKLKEYVT